MFRKVIDGVVDRLTYHVTTYVPSFLVALILILGAAVTALGTRWLIYRIFKGRTIDRYLRTSGVAFLIDRTGRLRATRIVAESTYWTILLSGVLMGLSVFNTGLTTQITQGFVSLLPKLVVAGFILLGGAWLGQYLGRGALVWAVNENLPAPRRFAAATRAIILFVTVVAAADQLNFARSVFLAAFVIIAGGAVLAASLAMGIGGAAGVRHFLEDRRTQREDRREPSLWNHL
ncbi:MAG: hypothetical protein U0Q16_02595 [Bryobacteraceae bacterium]